jgi:type II secretory pathway predicted ATPase ExeA
MYERFFGIDERPFELTSDPRYLLLTPTHQEALAALEYGVAARKGITLLVGEAGTGKTTLVRSVLKLGLLRRGKLPDLIVYLKNPTLTRSEFYQQLTMSFGLSDAAATSKTLFLRELETFLIDRDRRGELTALVIDEAQSLPHELLEEVRLLANLESDTQNLLPLVLAGQPELADRLNHANLRQFKQRIAQRCRLMPLDLVETAAYIAGRVRLAGGDDPGRLFTRDAVIAIFEASRGIPRTISVICDNALMAGFAADERPVDSETVEEVCRDFDLAVGSHAARTDNSQITSPSAPRGPVYVQSRKTAWHDRLRTAAAQVPRSFGARRR